MLALRDIHEPTAPAWWPPAPGWWLLACVVLAVAAIVLAVSWRRRRRRRALERMFDERVDAADTAPARIAALSELLRRAARRRDRASATLEGEDWLAFLDRGAKTPAFDGELGRLLLDGGFRRDVDDTQLDALRAAARERFLQLSGARLSRAGLSGAGR